MNHTYLWYLCWWYSAGTQERWKVELALGGWLVAYRNKCPVPGIESADTVAHISTNRARRTLTLLIEANALTTTPDHQTEDRHYCATIATHLRGRRRRVCRVWSCRVSRPLRRKSRCRCSTLERCDCGSNARSPCSIRSHDYATLHSIRVLFSFRRYSLNWNQREPALRCLSCLVRPALPLAHLPCNLIKTFINITLDPVLYYIYPALALMLVLNLLNSKPVSCGIPCQKVRRIKNFNSFKIELSNYLIDNTVS